MKKALITGVTGQDGGYLAELLLEKEYEVYAILRRNAGNDVSRIEHLLDNKNLVLRYGDLTDSSSLQNLFNHIRFDEVYNLAAQSHVRISFDIPEYTGDVNALGTARLLEAIRNSGAMEYTRFYQASTSELYGKVVETPQNEETPFYPRSPYGVAKLYSYWLVKNYRESYGLHGSNGILFNHESPWRGNDFVTQKIIKGVADIYKGKKEKISLGNLDAKRDWGHAKDYVEGMWRMLQHDEGDDYVLATGKLNSVRSLVETAFEKIGIKILWGGDGLDEVGVNEYGTTYVDVNPEFYRPAEVDLLLGDATKAKEKLGWTPTYSFKEMIDEMMESALK
jgi:GDPmannose 4,6-dehydratase|tara:strand:- start:4351 stop:5358 length:1008 start_codon:yes stop_codon:yes gene_type:complete